MGKVLIIKGADFSAVAVGSVPVDPGATPVVPIITLDTVAKTATLSTGKKGLTIKYTTDGSTPTIDSNTYNSAIDVSNGVTIKAISTNGETFSSVPKIAVTYDEANGTIAFASTANGTIRYSDDGSTPTATSQAYASPIIATSGKTYKVAVYNGSVIQTEVATIQI